MSPALRRRPRLPAVTMTSTLSRTNSAAISAKRSLRPSAQRYSIATVRPSIQPSSRSRCTKAAVHGSELEGVLAPRNPMVGSLPAAARAPRAASSRRAAEQRDELAPPHSITSSARASSVGGTSRPSALAVLRLITSSIFGRLLHRQVGGLFALEDAIDIAGRAAPQVDLIRAIGNEPAVAGKVPIRIDRGQPVPRRQRMDSEMVGDRIGMRENQQSGTGSRKRDDRALDLAAVLHIDDAHIDAERRRDGLRGAKK